MRSSERRRAPSKGPPLTRVRTGSAEDVDAVVAVHQAAFPGFFLTELGPRFLKQYYGVVLDYDGAIFLVCEDDDRDVRGFAVGFIDPQRFYGVLARRRRRLAMACLPRLMVRPWLAPRVVANRRRVQKLSGGEKPGREERVELASIGVVPAASRQGIGRALLTRFCECAKGLGARQVYLTTEAEDNLSVSCFYRSVGFNAGRAIELFRGRRLIEYHRDMDFS